MFELATRGAVSGTGATTIDRAIVTCETGARILSEQWAAEIARAGTIFGRRLFPDARSGALARAELLAALPAAHDFLIGASRTAGEIMRPADGAEGPRAGGDRHGEGLEVAERTPRRPSEAKAANLVSCVDAHGFSSRSDGQA